MIPDKIINYIAFEGARRIAVGSLTDAALAAKKLIDDGSLLPVLIFDSASGRVVDVDYRGQPDEVAVRLGEPPRGPGRPRLGVVAREITLLPRHWEWLNSQPGGASVALRKLVEQAKRAGESGERIRLEREAAYRFIGTMAGNEPGFEEAARALFAGNRSTFENHSAAWPPDVREHARRLAAGTWEPPT